MTFLKLIGEIIGASPSYGQKIKAPKFLMAFFNFLTAVAAIWLALEVKPIALKASPILFTVTFGSVGVAIAFLTMYLMWRLKWFYFFTAPSAFTIIIPIVLLTICCASSLSNCRKNLHFKSVTTENHRSDN
ncbi:hypothetical protein [Nubsella zeaxanthinifaciens]|uniref:hypothetical protein n=1 Tax=Nubsella zeaxanthinifaciens TaxID=392412 RepID=UPI000DE31532|nr:hypothetical protein [Nubsella zeaxanthinifaciens]